MLGNRLDPEGAKSMKKGRCGNILEPQCFVDGCTALMFPRMVIRAEAHLLASRHVFSRCFLLTAISEERRGLELLVHVNAIIQEVDAQNSCGVPEHCRHHLAG